MGQSINPSGMDAGEFERLRDGVRKSRHQEVAQIPSKHGTIFISEAYAPEEGGWEVMWVCRKFAQKMICSRWSAQADRVNAVTNEAMKFMREITPLLQKAGL